MMTRSPIAHISLVLVFAGSLAVCGHVKAATWYVRTDGTGSGTGSAASEAFGNIKAATAVAAAGDTIYVAPGTYSGTTNTNVGFTNDGTLGNPIRLQADSTGSQFSDISAGDVTISGGATAMDFSAANYVTIDGFTMLSQTYAGVYIRSACQGVTFTNNVVDGQNVTTYDNFMAQSAITDAVISNNTFCNAVRSGVTINGTSWAVTGNTICDAKNGIDVTYRNASNVVIDSNTIYDMTDPGTNPGCGIRQFYYIGRDIQITNNLVCSSDVGIQTSNIQTDATYTEGSAIVNNTVLGCLTGVMIESLGGGAYMDKLTVENNIVSSDLVDAEALSVNSAWLAAILSDHNDLDADVIADLSGTAYDTLAAWQAASSLDGNSTDVDPLLNAGYYPTAPAVINTGNNAAVLTATDLAGDVRIQDGTVDMGALEVPEPTTLVLLAMGSAAILRRRSRE